MQTNKRTNNGEYRLDEEDHVPFQIQNLDNMHYDVFSEIISIRL
jgi:hypothetical protein